LGSQLGDQKAAPGSGDCAARGCLDCNGLGPGTARRFDLAAKVSAGFTQGGAWLRVGFFNWLIL
jgi:hypothetical protein